MRAARLVLTCVYNQRSHLEKQLSVRTGCVTSSDGIVGSRNTRAQERTSTRGCVAVLKVKMEAIRTGGNSECTIVVKHETSAGTIVLVALPIVGFCTGTIRNFESDDAEHGTRFNVERDLTNPVFAVNDDDTF